MRLFSSHGLLVLLILQSCDARAVKDGSESAPKSTFFQGYGRNLDYPTPKASDKHNYDIAPWLATYEGETIKERQAYRHRILNQVCNSTEHTMIKKFHPQILVNELNKLVFCFIPKVGSATLLSTVLEANRLTLGLPKGDFNVHDLWQLERYGIKELDTYTKEEQENILRTHFKFFFVRHPLSRLRSAHRMFTEGLKKPGIQDQSILEITSGLLNGTDWKVKGFPNFESFIHLISSKWKEVREARTQRFDNFQDLCLPCYINYDFIGKHEYFAEELNYVLKDRLPNVEPVISNTYKTQWIEMDQIYSNFSKETLDLFLQRYGNDFRLFNYKY